MDTSQHDTAQLQAQALKEMQVSKERKAAAVGR